nr:MAG TPA: hypothetical protein [Caudoviricetes sp.]
MQGQTLMTRKPPCRLRSSYTGVFLSAWCESPTWVI